MDINEACRGMVYHDTEAKKEGLTGQVKVTLNYQSGGITKASIEKLGPLIPGARRPDNAADAPGKNMG